jgi:uncharacterized protein (DUF433 family)
VAASSPENWFGLHRSVNGLIIPHNREPFMWQPLTVNEAVALVGLEEKFVRKDVEYGIFGSESPPRFNLPALVYLRVIRELGLESTVAERKKIYALISEAFSRSRTPIKVEISPVLELKLADATKQVQSMLERFGAWKKKIAIDPDIMGGEPVFPKSRLTVRHIGSMMLRGRGDTLREIREDYPYLNAEDIEFAKLYTMAYPKVGRPRARKAAAR